jgi:Fuc2NAc and GlcNAc transferase
MPTFQILYLLIACALSILGTKIFISFAIQKNILAIPKNRSLHSVAVPKGGGIIIGGVFLTGLLILLLMKIVPSELSFALLGGGITLLVVGFIDDLGEVDPIIRFVIHFLVSFWALYCLGGMPEIEVGSWILKRSWILHLLGSLGIVWFINLFNFMDGVDGMLASNSIVFSLVGAFALFWLGHDSLAIMLLLLGASLTGFLVYNWPPARVFMGDSGAAFIGYTIAVVALYSTAEEMMNFWTWIILMGYFVADTTTTMFIKIATVPGWFYEEHRNHAYQQLALVWKSHRRVTLMVLATTTFWMAPMALLSLRFHQNATILAVIALAPIVILTLRRGPPFRP